MKTKDVKREAWLEANAEKIKAYRKEYRKANVANVKAYSKAYQLKNKEKLANYFKDYYKMKKTLDLTNTRARDIFSGKRIKQPNTYDLTIKCNLSAHSDSDAKALVDKLRYVILQHGTNIKVVLEEVNCITEQKRGVSL